MAAEDEIRQASEQFYAALNRAINGDPGPIMEVWSHGSDVTSMDPPRGHKCRMGRGESGLGAGRAGNV